MVSPYYLFIGALALQASAVAIPNGPKSPKNPPAIEKPSPKPPVAITKSAVDDAFSKAVREKRVPGIAAFALNRDGAVLYNNSWGTVDLNDPKSAPVTSKTRMQIASMTKSVVSIAALQLIEQGKLSIDDYVEDHYPAWKNVSVLDGWTAEGEPILRAPKTKAKIVHLFTHTVGLGYAFIHNDTNKYAVWAAKQTNPPRTPILAEPGQGWFYGESMDILGFVVEAISGQPLDQFFEYNIFRPLGMKDIGLISPDIHAHQRLPNGKIESSPPATVKKTDPPAGGYFLTSTIEDYATYLLTLINWGTHPQTGVTILKSSTIRKYVFTDLAPLAIQTTACDYEPKGELVGHWNSVIPTTSNSIEFFPGQAKGWSTSFLINHEDQVGRRKAGSGTWAGINNLYYWVDLKSGKLGLVFTHLKPFLDPTVLGLFDKLEEFVYA